MLQYLTGSAESMTGKSIFDFSPPTLALFVSVLISVSVFGMTKLKWVDTRLSCVLIALVPMGFAVYMMMHTDKQNSASPLQGKHVPATKQKKTEPMKALEQPQKVIASNIETNATAEAKDKVVQHFEDTERGVLRNRRGQVNKNGVLPSNDGRLDVINQEYAAFRTSEFDSRYGGMPKTKTSHPQAPPMMRYQARDGPAAGKEAKEAHQRSGPQYAGSADRTSAAQESLESHFKNPNYVEEDEDTLLQKHLQNVRSAR